MARHDRLNKSFVQVSNAYISTVALLASESPTAAALLLLLVAHMDRYGTACCDLKMMMEGTGKKQSAVYAALNTLESEMWVKRTTSGGASFYQINSRVFWAAAANLRHRGFDSELNRPKGLETGKPRIRVTVRESPSRHSHSRPRRSAGVSSTDCSGPSTGGGSSTVAPGLR